MDLSASPKLTTWHKLVAMASCSSPVAVDRLQLSHTGPPVCLLLQATYFKLQTSRRSDQRRKAQSWFMKYIFCWHVALTLLVLKWAIQQHDLSHELSCLCCREDCLQQWLCRREARGFLISRLIRGCVMSLLNMTPSSTLQLHIAA